MRRILLLLLFFSQFIAAQSDVDKLLDSLTINIPDKDKAIISTKIAWELRDSDWKRALHYIQTAETQAKKIDSEELTAELNVKIADIYNDKDAFDVALTYLLKSYDYYQQHEVGEKKYHTENSLAIIYARLNNKEKARYYFDKLLKHHSKKKHNIYTAKTLNNIGMLYLSSESADSAMVYFKKSLALAQQFQDEQLLTYLYTNLGISYTRLNDFANAKMYLDKSVNLSGEKADKKMKAWIFNSVSQMYLLQKQPDSALAYSRKAESLLQEVKYSFENKNAVDNIYKSYLMKGDYKNAAAYFKLHDEIRDSLNIEMKAMNVEKLKLEQQYKENEELRLLKESKTQFKYYLMGFGLVILMLVLGILLLRYRNRLTNARLEKDLYESRQKELDANLELRNKELMTRSMMEIQRTEILDQILDELKQLKLQSPKKETQQTIDVIIKQLGKNNNNDIWEEFELRYGQVYESFYNILNEKHPELTYRDKRLCALLKLNLTTKEVARITGQSVKSLENARTRLRKKLQLTNTNQDLITYLANLT
ncbi:MAG TPA: tetratricopeptide repeat protein [Flavobacterium sp.]|nr:tetratricopeptide repeat protein [Flavobacterium sp.]